MQAGGCFQFRLTRNSDLLVDEEEAKDLMEALEGELSQRQWGDIVRLEVAHKCPEQMWQYLTDVAQLTADDVIQVNRSEERRVGKECGSQGRFRWSPHPE